MKKIVLIIILLTATMLAAAQNNSNLLERVNIGLAYNITGNVNFTFGPGILKDRPTSAIEASASVRLWQHLGVGAHLSLMGAKPTTSAAIDIDPTTTLYTLGWENGYRLYGGLFAELHWMPFSKRHAHNFGYDMLLRGGYDFGGQADGWWGGIGMEWRLTKQLLLTMYADYGQLPFRDLDKVTENTAYGRASFGLKFFLK